MRWARKNGKTFAQALGTLINSKHLSKSSIAVKNLNFLNAGVRGSDIYRSILHIKHFSKNQFNFQAKLCERVGAKSDYDLQKKIIDYKFNNPLMLICALGAQFLRLEQRYILNGITFREAFSRKNDLYFTLMNICYDLHQFGLTRNILNYIFEFSSEIIDPTFDLSAMNDVSAQTFKRDDVEHKSNDSNDNDNSGNDLHLYTESTFTMNDTEIMYNISHELNSTVGIKTPIYSHYLTKRQHFGHGNKKDTIFDRFARNEKIYYCDNGACWNFNFGHSHCPHASPCTIKSEAHLATHYCAICGGPQPVVKCPFIRSFMFLSFLKIDAWFTRVYDLAVKYPAKPRTNNPNNGRGTNNSNKSKKHSTPNGGGKSRYDSYSTPPSLYGNSGKGARD